EVVRLFGYAARQADAIIEFSPGERAPEKEQAVMADDLAGAGVVVGLRIRGSARQLGAVFFVSDLSGDVSRHLVEGLEAHRRHRQGGTGDRGQTVRTDRGLKGATNLDLLAEDIGDGVAVFLLA